MQLNKVTEPKVTRLNFELRWSLFSYPLRPTLLLGILCGKGAKQGKGRAYASRKLEEDLECQVEKSRKDSALTLGKEMLLVPSSLCLLAQGPWGRGQEA